MTGPRRGRCTDWAQVNGGHRREEVDVGLVQHGVGCQRGRAPVSPESPRMSRCGNQAGRAGRSAQLPSELLVQRFDDIGSVATQGHRRQLAAREHLGRRPLVGADRALGVGVRFELRVRVDISPPLRGGIPVAVPRWLLGMVSAMTMSPHLVVRVGSR